MRAVADMRRRGWHAGTRYFPSKVHLLSVGAGSGNSGRIDRNRPLRSRQGHPLWLNFMVGKLSRAMQRNPLLTGP